MSSDTTITDPQLHTLLADVLAVHGYDFTSYSHSSIKRRISRLMSIDHFTRFDDFRDRLRRDDNYFTRFLEHVTVSATEMFRDASFYKLIRERVLPKLAELPQIRIWHAGCSTGEEVYSMAIMLHEADLLRKSLLYATDINPAVLASANAGVFPMANASLYADNYAQSGGEREFSTYYHTRGTDAVFIDDLRHNTVVAHHNLVSDPTHNKFHLIMCRNVLIYFDKALQDRILGIFHTCLEPPGFLAIGSKETLRFSGVERKFRQLVEGEKVYMISTKTEASNRKAST
jgi:chemotaxis protein methyltransferase CheR